MNTAEILPYKTELPFNHQVDQKTLNWFAPYNDKFTYNRQIAEEWEKSINSCGFKLSDQERKNLERYVYILRHRLREYRQIIKNERKLADGYIPLTKEVVTKAFQEKKKLLVNAEMSYDWLTSKVDQIYKPFVNQEGACYLMKPRARTRGYALSRFENAFCKIIK